MTNGKEVLQMAMDLERIGQGFYQSLASACSNEQVAAMCGRLAKAEAEHYVTFKNMLSRVARPGVDVPLTEDERERAGRLVRSQVMPDPAEVRKVGMGGNVKDALALAIKMEIDAIAFYESMLDLAPDDQPAVSRIIREEQAHLETLKSFAGH